MAICDNNMRFNKKTYVYFADAYKRFDRCGCMNYRTVWWNCGKLIREKGR